MVTKVEITNNEKLPLGYAKDLPAFANGNIFEFLPGVNIVVGPNGSGKSTLFKMMAMYFLCERTFSSQIPKEGFKMPMLFGYTDGELCDGIKIHADYMGVVYNYHSHSERDNDDIFSSLNDFSLYIDNATSSYGEQQMNTLQTMFDIAFSNKDVQFPLLTIKDMAKGEDDYWGPKMKALFNYYKENSIPVTEETFEYTFLFDEPDRNLDVSNIKTLSSIFGFHKPMTQIIAVVHNPLLIYSLSKKSDVNFIEMEDGYLNKVISAVDSIVSGKANSGRKN